LESCNDEAVLIPGGSAELELIVEPKYVEEFGLSWAKGSPEKASAPVRIGRRRSVHSYETEPARADQ